LMPLLEKHEKPLNIVTKGTIVPTTWRFNDARKRNRRQIGH
jgi:hypothetical protein